MRFLLVLLTLFSVCCSIPVAQAGSAGSIVERVKAHGVVRCGSVERPGLSSPGDRGSYVGLNVDICRAIATAILKSPERIEYHEYATPKQFDAVRHQQDDVYFLTPSEINEQQLAGYIIPGPTVFVESDGVMVGANSPVNHVQDLANQGICFYIGSSAERSLESYFDDLHQNWLHRPFSEEGEMNDAYDARNCGAVAGELTTLALNRFNPGKQLSNRILPESLTTFPIIAATGTQDGKWSAIVAWTIHTLISGERPEKRWYAGGAGAMPITAPDLGLDKEWQHRVLSTVGNYGDIFERNLGKKSPLKLDRGFNANQLNGGLLLSPFLE